MQQTLILEKFSFIELISAEHLKLIINFKLPDFKNSICLLRRPIERTNPACASKVSEASERVAGRRLTGSFFAFQIRTT
ncbi:hypothetical protein BpHYR1_036034 [Brachionus plicatilis]|uniref:Uncharacterized protein n=1 Tax=Brachionus plicatilis TaxID=10195 RepID=A0A3M7PUY9_BRAPC|nr:hypothetical protein BpHYR1_036034 [Brachionus plicatilis]